MFRKLTFPQVSLLIEYGANPEAKAQKRDISNGEYLTCDQLAQEVRFDKFEQVKTDAVVTMMVKRVTAQIKRRAKEKERTTIPNASLRKNVEEPLGEAGSRKQDGGSSETKKPSEHQAEEGKVGDTEKTAPPQGANSATGVTEKSDQMQAAGSHEENTTKEKPDVNSWMKNYKKQKKSGGKGNPGEQQKTPRHQETNEKAKQTSSSSRRETVHQRSEEKESHAEQTDIGEGNKVEDEQEKRNKETEERPKVKQTREERRDDGESGGDLENREDLESNKVQVADRQEHGRMNREECSVNAPTNDGKSEGSEIRGRVDSTEGKSEEGCKWPDDLDRYRVAIHKPSFDFDENLKTNLC